MENKRSRLCSELAKLDQAIKDHTENIKDATALLMRYETQIQEDKNEQKDIMERMGPELCSFIELGRQLERGFN